MNPRLRAQLANRPVGPFRIVFQNVDQHIDDALAKGERPEAPAFTLPLLQRLLNGPFKALVARTARKQVARRARLALSGAVRDHRHLGAPPRQCAGGAATD